MIIPNIEEKLTAFKQLLEVVYELREKCPWDKEQTWETLRPLTIEETYELTDSIISEDYTSIKKELGDVLLHILFYSRIGEQENRFDIAAVCDTLREKLIHRHPHIYGEMKADDAEAVKQNWEQIKMKEGAGQKSVLQGVPPSMPSIIKAYRLQEKAASVGFDWEKKEEVWAKVKEELQEFEDAENPGEREDEFGDLLFSLINYSRFIKVEPDNALEKTNRKFIQRFRYIEKKALEAGKNLKEMTLEEMDVYWNEAKRL